MLRIVRKYKRPQSRKLYIYAGIVLVDIISPYNGWISHSELNKVFYNHCRLIGMRNLYWLLGKDCGYDEWKEMVEYYDKGRGVNGIPGDTESMFFEGEKEEALKSFYNNEIYQNY